MADEVLIVEDDIQTQLLMSKVLEKVGVSSISVSSAEAALELLSTKEFFLILSDINLPGLTGTDLAKKIRAQEAGTSHHTFLVAITGHVDEYTRAKCIEAGMDGYLTKPLDRLKLQSFVQKVMNGRKASAPTS